MKFGYRFAFEFSSSAILLAGGAAFAQTPTTERVSVSSSGAPGNLESGNIYGRCSISPGGRFVAFDSVATNLVAGDTNARGDVFVRDRANGTTDRVSVDSNGVEGNDSSGDSSISADGRFVAFDSYATNFALDTNATLDVFVRDRQLGTTERVNVDSSGTEANAFSAVPAISADGRFVAFMSYASNLVAGDTNGKYDVFVRDRQLGTTERVSLSTAGIEGDLDNGWPSISADGRFVAFSTDSTNLVAGDTNGMYDVFVRDRLLGKTERVSVATGGTQANSHSQNASISADGRFVAFQGGATNLVAGDTNAVPDVFVHDRLNGTTGRVSVASGGAQADGFSSFGTISGDGRFVAFESQATNLVLGDTNGFTDVFVHDRTTGETERVNVTPSGMQVYDWSGTRTISADGRFVVFTSQASSLDPGDTNGHWDTFVRDRGLLVPGVFCTGGDTTNGCRASISANANPSVSFANACNITVTGVEGRKLGVLFYGVSDFDFTPVPWSPGSSSWQCVSGPLQRTPFQNSLGQRNHCNGSFALDWNAYQTAHPLALGHPWSSGARVFAQAWFRDPPAPGSTNLSNAVELIYQP
jgi:Tol biopolymer transport system component